MDRPLVLGVFSFLAGCPSALSFIPPRL